LCSLGRVCIAVGRYSEAERLYQRVLSIRERVLGSEHHPETARIWSQMAKLYLFEKQYGKAAACGQSDSHLRGGTRTRPPRNGRGPHQPSLGVLRRVVICRRRGTHATRAQYLREVARAGASADFPNAEQPGEGT